MVNSYARAYTEVLEVLSCFSKEDYSKIPSEKIKYYKENMDKDYTYIISSNLELSLQYISDEANAILVSLFRDYFANEAQKETLNRLLKENQEKKYRIQELTKNQKYDSNSIFKKNNTVQQEKEEVSLAEIKKENKLIIFFRKILKLIK